MHVIFIRFRGCKVVTGRYRVIPGMKTHFHRYFLQDIGIETG